MSTPPRPGLLSWPLRVAIGLGGIGFLAVLLGVAVFGRITLARFWRRLRQPPPEAPGRR